MNSIGTVICTPDGPNSSKFSFIVNEKIRKGQFVSVDTEEGKIIARVADVFKTNRYFESAESVQEFERSGKSITELFPVKRWEYLVANAVSLGVFNSDKLERSSFPPSPGSKVFLADSSTLSKFFGFDENGLHLGKVEYHDLDVKLNMTRLLQKHLAILGISGSGKSYGVSVLIEELLDRKKENGQMAVVVIDTHGEYIGFGEDPAYRDKTNVILGKDFKIGVPGLTGGMISEFIHGLTTVQKRELDRLFSMVNEEYKGRVFDMYDILKKLETDEIIKNASTRNILHTYLSRLNSTRLFGPYDNPSLDKLAVPGNLTVIDISDMTDMKSKQIVVTYLSRKLFDARRAGIVPPFAIIVEEAHNFAPEGIKVENAISKGIIEKIAREGRKFHACLVLVSQRPIRLSTTALSQCNTHFILRVTNPYDLKHIGESSEGITSDVQSTISSLKVGEALIVGEAVNYPLFFKIRERRSKKSERGIALEDACKKWDEERSKRKEDINAFM